MKEEDYLLYDYCSGSKSSRLTNLLTKYPDLDLTQRDGICFKLAIKHNDVVVLRVLLKHYKLIKLQLDSAEYVENVQKLSSIFENAEDAFTISSEIHEIVAPHIIAEDGLILLKVKKNLSEAGFTLPHFHGHLDQVGFNDANEDDLRAVLDELETLKSRLHHMCFDEELGKKVQIIDDQIKEIKEVIDPSVDLEGFGAIPDEWDCDEDDGVGNTVSDYAVVGLMGNDNGGDHFPLAAEDGFSPHSPYITSH